MVEDISFITCSKLNMCAITNIKKRKLLYGFLTLFMAYLKGNLQHYLFIMQLCLTTISTLSSCSCLSTTLLQYTKHDPCHPIVPNPSDYVVFTSNAFKVY